MSLPLKLRCEMAISAAGAGSSHLGFLKQMFCWEWDAVDLHPRNLFTNGWSHPKMMVSCKRWLNGLTYGAIFGIYVRFLGCRYEIVTYHG